MEMLPDSPTSPMAVLASAREQVASLTETLWAAARPEVLLDVTVELERLRSLVAAVEAQVAVEVEAAEAAKTAGWVSPGDYLTHTAGGRHGHGSRLLRTARPLCGDRAATLVALQAGEVSPEQAEVIVAVIDRLPGQPALRDEAERMLLDQAASLNASELRKAGEHLLEVLDPDGTARADEAALDRLERSAHLGRFLTIAEDGIGGVRVRGRGTVEDAALIKNALHALAAPRPGTDPDCADQGRDSPRPARPRCESVGRPGRDLPESQRGRRAAPGPARRQTPAHRHRHPGPAQGRSRGRDLGHRRPGLRHRPPETGVRRRGHPRRPRLPWRGPRRRPHPPPGHHRHLESPHPARRALPLPRLPGGCHSPATPTTSSTGPTAAPPSWTTWSCSAEPTTP